MKRFLDVLLSLLAIIFLSPLMLVICLIIICDDGMPVIFRQDRVGKGNELFKIKKFRTMKNGAPNLSTADFEQSDEFITRSGKFLRRTSLDELPQLFNVLAGDMSFIGPRPLIPEESHIRELRREYGVYSVRPGLTGRSTAETASPTRKRRNMTANTSSADRSCLTQKYFSAPSGSCSRAKTLSRAE